MGLIYYTLKFHLKMEDKLKLVNKHNYKDCILSWFDPIECSKEYDYVTADYIKITDDDKRSIIQKYL